MTVFAYKQFLICAYFSPGSDEMTFSLEKAILWMEDLHFFEVIILKMALLLTNTQLFTSQNVN